MSENVGTATITLEVRGDRIRSQVHAAMRDIVRDMEGASRASDDLGEHLDRAGRTSFAPVRREIDRTERQARRASANMAGGFGSVSASVRTFGAQVALIGPAALAAAGGVSALAVGAAGALALTAPAIGAVALGMDGIRKAAGAASGALNEVKTAVSATFEREMTPSFERLGGLLQSLTPQLQAVASSVSGLFAGLTDTLTMNQGQIQTIVQGSATFISNLTPGLQSLTQGFIDFGVVAAGNAEGLGKAFSGLFQSIGDELSTLAKNGDLDALFKGFEHLLDGISQLIGPVIGLFVELGIQVSGPLGDAFGSLGGIIRDLTPGLGAVVGLIADGLAGALHALEPLAKPISDGLLFLVGVIREVWDWISVNLVPIFKELWDLFLGITEALSPLIEPLQNLGMAVLPIVTEVFGYLRDVIRDATPIIEEIAGKIADFLAPAIQFLADNIPVWWDVIKGAFQIAWAIIQPIIQALADGIAFAWTNVIKPAWDAMIFVLGILRDAFSFAWNNVIKPVWDALGAGISWVWNNVISPAWDAMKAGLDIVSGAFDRVVEGIGNTWNKLKHLLAVPINFLINTVWNEGILKAWNKAAGLFGIDPTPAMTPIAENAMGGAIRGRGTGTSDDILSWLSNGEHVMTAAEVLKAGGQNAIYTLRDMIARGIPFEWDGGRIVAKLGAKNVDRYGAAIKARGLGNVDPNGLYSQLGFASGGAVEEQWMDQVSRAHEFAKKWSGSPYVWGGSLGPDGGTDCSGFMSSIADVILGGDGLHRKWATGAFPGGGDSQGDSANVGGQSWLAGLSQGFSIGVSSAHTAGTLSGAGNFSPSNVESGGAHGNVLYGGAGADDGQFPTRYHLPITNGAFESAADNVDPGVMRDFIRNQLTKMANKILDPVKSGISGVIGSPPPSLLGIPGAELDKGRDSLTGWMADKVTNIVSGLWSIFKKAKDLLNFDEGGYMTGIGVNSTGKPERVLTPAQTQSFDALIGWLTGGDWRSVADSFGKACGEAAAPAISQGVTQAAAPVLNAADSFVSEGVLANNPDLYDDRGTGISKAELQAMREKQWQELTGQTSGGGPTVTTNNTTQVPTTVTVNTHDVDLDSLARLLGSRLLELIDH